MLELVAADFVVDLVLFLAGESEVALVELASEVLDRGFIIQIFRVEDMT